MKAKLEAARALSLKDSRILDNEGKCSYLTHTSLMLIIKTGDKLRNVRRWLRLQEAKRTRNSRSRDVIIPVTMMKNYLRRGTKVEGTKRAVLSKYDEFLEGPREAVGITL